MIDKIAAPGSVFNNKWMLLLKVALREFVAAAG